MITVYIGNLAYTWFAVVIMLVFEVLVPDFIVECDAAPVNWTANSSIVRALVISSTTIGMVVAEDWAKIDETLDFAP